MCGLEIPIEDKGKYPLCYGLSNELGEVDMCNSCNFQHDCAAVTMQGANKYALSFRFTSNGTCLYCGKKRTFCFVLEYGEISIKLCLADVARMEHKAFEWKIEEDEKNTWKPH